MTTAFAANALLVAFLTRAATGNVEDEDDRRMAAAAKDEDAGARRMEAATKVPVVVFPMEASTVNRELFDVVMTAFDVKEYADVFWSQALAEKELRDANRRMTVARVKEIGEEVARTMAAELKLLADVRLVMAERAKDEA